MNNRDVLLPFLLGAAMGAAAGVLLAPASGQETRDRVRRRGGQTLDRGREALWTTKESVKDSVRGKAEEVKDLASKLSEGAHQRLDAAKVAIDEGKATYRREVDKPSTP